MSTRNQRGLRLLSLDGGGIRGMSELLILKEIMMRIQSRLNLDTIPYPCDIFDIIGGTSTGGLIALLLGRLRLPIDIAIMYYATLAERVFSKGKKSLRIGRGAAKFKASALAAVVKDIVKKNTGDADSCMMDTRSNRCHTFVCARPSYHLNAGIPVLFRTHRVTKNNTSDCAIWEAARATSAAPTFFKNITIGGPGSRQPYIDGGIGVNNPTSYVLEEAGLAFPGRKVACVVSIGSGQKKITRIQSPGLFQRILPRDLIYAMAAIATDCEITAQQITKRFRYTPNFYFRFTVEQGMQGVSMEQWDQMQEVSAHTEHYLNTEEVNQRLDAAVDAILECRGIVNVAHIGTEAERR